MGVGSFVGALLGGAFFLFGAGFCLFSGVVVFLVLCRRFRWCLVSAVSFGFFRSVVSFYRLAYGVLVVGRKERAKKVGREMRKGEKKRSRKN